MSINSLLVKLLLYILRHENSYERLFVDTSDSADCISLNRAVGLQYICRQVTRETISWTWVDGGKG